MGHPCLEPRLLTKDQAADYIGFSRAAFERHCTVTPMRFGDDRLTRYDRLDLDDWIDALKTRAGGRSCVMTDDDMDRALREFEG